MELTESGERFSVAGKQVVVTGGSRGIGLMIARGFIESGADVIISSRNAEACDAAARELGELGRCVAIPADLGTDDGVRTLVDAVADRWGNLDVLVNNAGATWGSPFEEYPANALDKLWRVNVRAVFSLTQGLLPQLRSNASSESPARVINIGSVDGLRVPVFDNFGYSATKAAVHMLTRHLAVALAPRGITVNAIAPGPFRTKMLAPVLDDEDLQSEILASIPLARLGLPGDIASLAIFLAGPAATWMTGAVIPLDGGVSLRS